MSVILAQGQKKKKKKKKKKKTTASTAGLGPVTRSALYYLINDFKHILLSDDYPSKGDFSR